LQSACLKEYNTKVYLKEKIYATLAHIKSIIPLDKFYLSLGKTRIIAETGLDSTVLQQQLYVLDGVAVYRLYGRIDIKRQAPNVARMKMLGAEVRPALSGSKTLKMLQTIRDWINNPVDTYYIIGSVVGPHPYPDMVARFQSVVSEEIKIQLLEKKEEKI
jgi:tryptophan synthase beta chain